MSRSIFIPVVFLCLLAPLHLFAQEVYEELKETVRAEVVEVVKTYERAITGTNATATVQTVRVEVQEGLRVNHTVTFDTDVMQLQEGDDIYVNRIVHIDGTEYFVFKDINRDTPLIVLFLIFSSLLLLLARFQGLRALLSLLLSIAIIILVLVPLLLSGYPPVLTSVLISALVLGVVIFLTHGLNARASIAFCGTVGAVTLTGIIAAVFVEATRLTGFGSDAAIYLNFSTGGALDFGGLLLGGIMIGVLGVLDDVAIAQVSVVRELKAANSKLDVRALYERALRVGRDHVGSLVNTLALAYMGVSLPLVLLYSRAGTDLVFVLNQEIVAAEIVRALVGSIGLILAVPLTTAIAAWWFAKQSDIHVDENNHHVHYH